MKKDASTVEVRFTKDEIAMLNNTLVHYKYVYDKVKHIQNIRVYYNICAKFDVDSGICYYITTKFFDNDLCSKIQEVLNLTVHSYLCFPIYESVAKGHSLKQRNDTFRVRIKALEKILKKYE